MIVRTFWLEFADGRRVPYVVVEKRQSVGFTWFDLPKLCGTR